MIDKQQLEKDLQELNDLLSYSKVSYYIEDDDMICDLGGTEHNFCSMEHMIKYTFYREHKKIILELDYRGVEGLDCLFDWHLTDMGFIA